MNELHFGTDGIRGVYGRTLTEETAYRLGAALGKRGELLIGRDNRPSSPSLARALACGAASVGGCTVAVGLTTTPALYYLLTRSVCAHAVMVTASHNPPTHNGLKVFSRQGKLSEEDRIKIELEMGAISLHLDPDFPLAEDPSLLGEYEDFFLRTVGNLKGSRIVLDYAGGAGYAFKGLLETLGAQVTAMNLRESGGHINEGCGALHPEHMAEETRRQGADLGIAIDGDGDRLIVADREGRLSDGDAITYLFACKMKKARTLARDKVVMTVMTNSGVLKSLSREGISVISCAVGDAAVTETMKAERLNLGGEQSGHVILGDCLMTGDALLAGAMLLKSIREEGVSLTPPPEIYPQILLNVAVPDKSVAYDPALQSLAAEIKEELKEGRVLLRASGTEEVVRIMVEHPREPVARAAAERLKASVLRARTI